MSKPFSRPTLVLAVVAACGIGAFAGSFARIQAAPSVAAPTAVAMVNIRQVMAALKEYAALKDMQNTSYEAVKKQNEAKQSELKGLESSAQYASVDDRQKMQTQYTEKAMMLKAWVAFQKEELGRQEAAGILGLYKKVCARAQKLAEDKGYDLLLAQNLTAEQLKGSRPEEMDRIVNGDREVLWARKSIDLTTDLIAAMDNDFAQRGATAPVAPAAPAK